MKSKIFSLVVIFLVSLGASVVIIFNSNPESGKIQIFAFFFFLFLVLLCMSQLIYVLIAKAKGDAGNFAVSIRRSGLISLVIVGPLALKALNILNLISLIALILTLALVELYLTLKKKNG
jgi:O-antigen/teichoic acid export membrane protein